MFDQPINAASFLAWVEQALVPTLKPGDIVVIAGKGHETYQQFAQETIPFDDARVAQAAIEARPVELS